MRSVPVVALCVALSGCSAKSTEPGARTAATSPAEPQVATEEPREGSRARDVPKTMFADLDGDGKKEHISVVGSLLRIGDVMTTHDAAGDYDVTIVDLEPKTASKQLALVDTVGTGKRLHLYTFDGSEVVPSEPINIGDGVDPAPGDGTLSAGGKNWELKSGRLVPAP